MQSTPVGNYAPRPAPKDAVPLGALQMRLALFAKRYRAARDKSGGMQTDGSAEAVVASAIMAEFGPRQAHDTAEIAAFIADIVSDPGIMGILAAMAGYLAIASARWADAEEIAERIISGDQHDLFAQRILLASRERSTDLGLEVDEWLRDRFCANPFEEIEIRDTGNVNTCCSAWMPRAIGSVHITEANGLWNSPVAREVRRSILDGDFSYCSRLYCPKIVKRTLPLRSALKRPLQRACATMRLTTVDHKPRRVVLSQDRSCNLSCPSCRVELIQMDKRSSDALDTLYDERILPLLSEARRIKITGSGDPFGSRHFRHVLKRLTDAPRMARRLQIQTNGVLFDAKAWKDLRLEGHVDTVWISMDATERGTYEVVRRGGDFDRLLANLRFLGSLRAEGRFNLLRLDFVVQAANFREMPGFVRLARSVGADGVHFLMLRNWGTFSPEEFRSRNVGSPAHPRHGAFLATLGHPDLADTFADLGNVSEWFSHAPDKEVMQPIRVEEW